MKQDDGQQQDAEEETQDVDQRQRRLLLHGKAEAQSRYNEGRRLAEQRDAHRNRLRGAYQPAPSFSSWQLNLLERWDSGVLLQELNGAVAAWGMDACVPHTANT